MSDLARKTAENLRKIRATKPLIHNITNFVVMNFTANILLATGASPVMAHAENEVEEMVGFAGALVLNIGTLTDVWVESMLKAGRRATELGKPIVFDPGGAGATALRTAAAKRILAATKVSVVRGNASEILSLSDQKGGGKGVDAIHSVEDAGAIAALNNQAVQLHGQGKYKEAAATAEKALALAERTLGPEHPETLTSESNLALIYKAQGRKREAEPLYQRVLTARERVLGPEHPDTL